VTAGDAPGDVPAIRLRRLGLRAWRRGTREMDLILGPYADARLAAMAPAEVDAFEALIAEEDTELLAWVLGQADPPARHAPLIAALRRHAAEIRRN
jgi:antitoxin CptB